MIIDISLSFYSLATQKLRLDFRAVSGFLWPGGGMEDADELIGRLCTIAGMVMEDTIDVALIGGATRSRSERLAVISQAGEDVSAIATVAAIVARRWASSDE
jgi:hypothetical protein